jgi:hypothetical protein
MSGTCSLISTLTHIEYSQVLLDVILKRPVVADFNEKCVSTTSDRYNKKHMYTIKCLHSNGNKGQKNKQKTALLIHKERIYEDWNR